jgi:putative membrane protein
LSPAILAAVQGFIIGAGGILPGISGASLAVVFGVYEDFMSLIAHPVRQLRPFAKSRGILCLGIAAGFVSFTLLLDRYFGEHQTLFVFLFSGLIAGTLPAIFRAARAHGTGAGEIAAFAVTAGLLAALAFFGPEAMPARTGRMGLAPAFFSGAVIAGGSLLPGVSASFILIYLGFYAPLLDALKNLDLGTGAALGLGALASIVALSRLIAFLYRTIHGIMSFSVLGFTLGSLVLVLAGIRGSFNVPACIVLALAGFFASFLLAREKR